MSYTVKIIKQADQKTSLWSGGTTTELAIYPSEAKYSERNFIWRLSSATVTDEVSTFTSLPGISRVLMVLDGVLVLDHSEHHSVRLQPFEQDRFSGDWTTYSRGKVRDFNLMMAAGCQGKLETFLFEERQDLMLANNPSGNAVTAIYCVTGAFRFKHDGRQVTVNEGDLVLVEENLVAGETLQLNALQQPVRLIGVTLQINATGR